MENGDGDNRFLLECESKSSVFSFFSLGDGDAEILISYDRMGRGQRLAENRYGGGGSRAAFTVVGSGGMVELRRAYFGFGLWIPDLLQVIMECVEEEVAGASVVTAGDCGDESVGECEEGSADGEILSSMREEELLNGNQLTGPLPEELGYLPNLNRIQINQNQISGSLPKSFAYLNKTKHFHMNNNSISGQILPELSRLPNLLHLLLDNNNISGYLPPELSELPNLLILQLDNNNFNGSTIPASYSKMTKLLKLSLRNCSLHGPIPDLSSIPNLGYLDLSFNQLQGSLPPNRLSENITTNDLSDNNLQGPISDNFSGLSHLQNLLLENNSLNGSVPSTIWLNSTSRHTETLTLDFRNNLLTNISGSLNLPTNVTVRLASSFAIAFITFGTQFYSLLSNHLNL
ncbi:hypothetical protein NE237_002891 [Protea cynaroides]|uniref:Uncharacterized protein n=1 Tax=Protea cynaroides TaxID=273540 RepID=A0A9Q0QS25_9MAGN|nr:hypothetical protein NE237_002891 [Protea cynaroides]